MTTLFVHGADGYEDDQAMVAVLRGRDRVRMPAMPTDMRHAAWAMVVADHLVDDVDTVVGHSFGGSTLLRMAAEGMLGGRRVVALAAPDWGPDGWDVADYALPERVPDDVGARVALHHCLDDTEVPPEHLELLASRLPGAAVTRHPTGGHQLEGPAIEAVADTLR